MRRAARWDGFFPLKWRSMVTVDDWRSIQSYIRQHRTSDAPFDWVQGGQPPLVISLIRQRKLSGGIRKLARPGGSGDPPGVLVSAGTICLSTPEVVERMNTRIRQGPPKFI